MKGSGWILLAAFFGGLGVMMGAYHAHGLEKRLQASDLPAEDIAHRMQNCEVAVRYQMYQSLAILGIGIISLIHPRRRCHAAGFLMTLGMMLFCGGLYSNVFQGPILHWSIVPLGGLVMIFGWLMLGACGIMLNTRAGNE